MSEANGLEINGGRLQDFTIDQLAGAIALSLGAVGTLLLVIWQSRCVCKCRLGLSDKCYLFDCSREPPPVDDTPVEDAQEPSPEPEPEPEQIIPSTITAGSRTTPARRCLAGRRFLMRSQTVLRS